MWRTMFQVSVGCDFNAFFCPVLYIFKGESSLEKVEILRHFENEKRYRTVVCGKR